MFTVTDKVDNAGSTPVTLHPYALVSRHGRPHVSGYYILHEGLLGYLGEDGLQEIKYTKLDEDKTLTFQPKEGWLGITDEIWATALVPPRNEQFSARFAATPGDVPTYQGDYLLGARQVAPGSSTEVSGQLFAGAKEVRVINAYEKNLKYPALRADDRLGLVLLHHQADVLADRLLLSPARQFRPLHPRCDGAREGGVLPARRTSPTSRCRR